MRFGYDLPELTRFTFGTGKVSDRTNPTHQRVVREAMEAGVWFHTSAEYDKGGVFQTLKQAFDEAPSQRPPCIFKVDGKGADLLRQTVENSLRGTGVERVDIAQVCGGLTADDLQPGAALHDAMVDLRDKGLVGSYVLEIFWSRSPSALPIVEQELFGAYIYYLNVVNREIDNAVHDAIHAKAMDVLALRTVGGGVENYQAPPDSDAARAALEKLYQRSGCDSRFEFRMRYVLSRPNVKTTIGATANPEHLRTLIEGGRNFQPLDPAIVAQIDKLHREWFADRGLG